MKWEGSNQLALDPNAASSLMRVLDWIHQGEIVVGAVVLVAWQVEARRRAADSSALGGVL
jgi:hypothetical protein